MTEELNSMQSLVVEKVLHEISQERRIAHEDVRAAIAALRDAMEELNLDPSNVQAAEAATVADADLRAHHRFKGHMPQQAYDQRKLILERAHHDAQAAIRARRKAAEAALAPLQERLQSAQARVAELNQEWGAHQRIARAAGIDLAKYWTPENPNLPKPEPETPIVEV